MSKPTRWIWPLPRARAALLTCVLAAFAPEFAAEPPALPGYTSDGDFLIAVDRLTGDTVPVGPYGLAGSRIDNLAFHVDGRLLGLDDLGNRLVEIDTATGAASVVGPLGIDLTAGGLAVDSCGDVWLSTSDGVENVLARLDAGTGAAQVLWSGYPSRFGLAALGSRLLAAVGGDSQALYEVDRATGELQLIAAIDPPSVIRGQIPSLDFDGGGELWGLSSLLTLPPPPAVGVFTIDVEDGTLGSLVTLDAIPATGLAIEPPRGSCVRSAVDVPALGPGGGVGLALLLALASVAVLRRRRSAI